MQIKNKEYFDKLFIIYCLLIKYIFNFNFKLKKWVETKFYF